MCITGLDAQPHPLMNVLVCTYYRGYVMYFMFLYKIPSTSKYRLWVEEKKNTFYVLKIARRTQRNFIFVRFHHFTIPIFEQRFSFYAFQLYKMMRAQTKSNVVAHNSPQQNLKYNLIL